MRSGRKNARGAGRTKEWNDKARQKWRLCRLTKKAPYKPDAGDRHVRFDERGWETERCRMAQATAPILDSTIASFRRARHVRFTSNSVRILAPQRKDAMVEKRTCRARRE